VWYNVIMDRKIPPSGGIILWNNLSDTWCGFTKSLEPILAQNLKNKKYERAICPLKAGKAQNTWYHISDMTTV